MTDKDTRDWVIERRETVYSGFYQIDRVHFKHTFHQGGWTQSLQRELFVRGNVVAVLPYDPSTDKVVLVEQFRIGAMHQKPDPWLLIEPNETPEEVAVRESREEAGLQLEQVELISHYLASPGATTEEVFIYFAETDLSQAGGVFGLAHEDEDIQVHVVSAEEAIGMLDSRKVRNAISVVALQWLQYYRLKQGITGP